MNAIQLFFEWPIKDILRQEANIINRSRLRLLSYGLMLGVITAAIVIVSLYIHHNKAQADRALMMYIILVIGLLITKLNIINLMVMVHFQLICMIVLVWTSIFYFNREINLVTTQFISLIFIYANYLLDKQGRFIYPIISILPIVLFMIFQQEIQLYPSHKPLPVDPFAYFVTVIHNFVFIFFTQYYFLNTFNHAAAKLQASRKELATQVLFQKRLIGGISHDIKSPLKYLAITIRGVFKRAEAENSEWTDDLKDAYESSFKLYNFTENLLRYAHVYLENNEIDLNEVNLYELINEKIGIFSLMAGAQECKVYNNVDPKVKILTSKWSLTVIINNLLENAIKHTPRGSVEFNTQLNAKEFTISINDTGCGMKPELMDWCNKAKSSENYREVNALALHPGLGLIIVDQLLQKIGGKMLVTNMPVSGTSIQLILPVQYSFTESSNSYYSPKINNAAQPDKRKPPLPLAY